jgi:hypothetical protein
MASMMMLGDSTLTSLTPSVNSPCGMKVLLDDFLK